MRIVLYILLAVNAAYLYLNVEHWRSYVPSADRSIAYVKQLVLLSEAAADELRPRGQDAPVADADAEPVAEPSERADVAPAEETQAESSAAPAPAVVALGCYSVGPLAEGTDQQAVAQWLSEQGAHAELREDERRELARYWVHLPPLDSLESAREQVVALRSAGIEDLHVIRRGNMANAVSLGLYSRKAHLERRVTKLKRAGIEPKVQERYRTYKSSWFDVVAPADSPLNDEALAERFPEVESRSRVCAADGNKAVS